MPDGNIESSVEQAGSSGGLSQDNDPRFVDYYEQESLSEESRFRAERIYESINRIRQNRGLSTTRLRVADIGCNAGTQSMVWLKRGHHVDGLDISSQLIELAKERSKSYGTLAKFVVGSATSLPWEDAVFDVCILPELLEHVDDWETTLKEAARVTRPGGSLYLSTTNRLCPKQQEFNLPFYSWYPDVLKRRYVNLSLTTKPELANFATFPAVHWFTPYGLSQFLAREDVDTLDRFDLIDVSGKSSIARALVRAALSSRLLRFMGHVCTPSTVLLGFKRGKRL